MTTRQCYRHIVIPQATKSMLPLVIGEFKSQLRATSYAGYVSQQDLIKAVYVVREMHDDMFVLLVIASIFYLIIVRIITRGLEKLCVKIFKYD